MIDGLKPYLSMKDSGVPWLGKVPEHWGVRRLRNVVEMRVSNVDKHSKDDEIPVRLCNYVDVYKNRRISERMTFMRATATPEEITRFRLESGDVLITKDSESWNDIGVPAIVEKPANDLVCGYHLAILRAFKEFLDCNYLFRALQSTATAYQFHIEANGVTRYGLSHAAIKCVLMPIPPLPEQAAIVRFLDYAERRIRRYIRAEQKLINLLEEQKQAIIQHAVTRGLDSSVPLKPSGIPWLGDIPQRWQVKRIKYLLREVDCRSKHGTEPLLSMRMQHGLVLFAEHYSRPPQAATLVGFKIVRPGQFVVNRMQAGNGLIYASRLTGLVSPDYAVFDPTGDANVDFLGELFRSRKVRTKFRAESKGLGTGSSGFLRLYNDRLGAIHVALPPRGEQAAILVALADELRTVNSSIDLAEREIELLREYRVRLIADVVTGKLDVREATAKLPVEAEDMEVLDTAEESEGGEDVGDDVAPDEETEAG